VLFAFRISNDRRVFAPCLLAPHVVQTQVRDDAVDPRIKRTLEAEVADMPVRLQECLLVHILGVLFGTGEVKSQPENGLGVLTYEGLERRAISAWRLPYEFGIVDSTTQGCADHANLTALVE